MGLWVWKPWTGSSNLLYFGQRCTLPVPCPDWSVVVDVGRFPRCCCCCSSLSLSCCQLLLFSGPGRPWIDLVNSEKSLLITPADVTRLKPPPMPHRQGDLAREANVIGSCAEGCPCHDHTAKRESCDHDLDYTNSILFYVGSFGMPSPPFTWLCTLLICNLHNGHAMVVN